MVKYFCNLCKEEKDKNVLREIVITIKARSSHDKDRSIQLDLCGSCLKKIGLSTENDMYYTGSVGVLTPGKETEILEKLVKIENGEFVEEECS